MRIVVTGHHGQIVQSLREKAALRKDMEFVTLGRPELDLAHPDSVCDVIMKACPDIVVSAAAYTAVDRAEGEPERAFAINARGAEAVALASKACGVPVIHLSTDYVFAGDSGAPYTEDDETLPRNVYGNSKLEGERLVAKANPQHIILRTAWIYSPSGNNFVRTMLKLAQQRDSISVVADQWGNPSSALDLASAILRVTDLLAVSPDASIYGLYHLAGTGDVTWSGFARAIFEESGQRGGPTSKVSDIQTSQYPTRAYRPPNSRLACGKFNTTFGREMPHWRASLPEVVDRLLAARR